MVSGDSINPSSGEPVVLGIDLGTSAVKVVAMTAQSTVIASGAAAFQTFSTVPEQAEQDPADWLSAVRSAVSGLDRDRGNRVPDWRNRVAAIGLTGQLPTLVCIGANGPLGRAITWKDARADEATANVLDRCRRRTLYEQTGMPVDGRYLGPMFRHHWLVRHTEVECILSAKDFLAYALTGARLTDPSTAAGYGAFDLAQGEFSRDLCDLWRMPPETMPVVRPSHSIAGLLNKSGADLLGLTPGVPVSVGAADSVSSAMAMAGLEEGIACITMGSSTVIIDAVRGVKLDPLTRYLLTPHVETGWYGREMDLLATGTGYRWLTNLLGLADGMLDQRAAQSRPGARGLVFAPYLAGGEQGALWDSSLRGAVSGLTLHHTADDLARAFLEGVGFEIRRCLSVLAETTPVREVVVAGHVTEHPTSLQMLADILNQPVQPYPAGSPAAVGAGLSAFRMIAARRADSASTASKSQPNPDSIPSARHRDATWPAVVPPGTHTDAYHRLYATYLTRTRAQRSADATRLV